SNLFTASSFAVNCGSNRFISGSDNLRYETDDVNLQAASYNVTGAPTWGVSNVGKFMDAPNGNYIIYSSRQFQHTLDSELFLTSRMSPSSLRYYGIGLENGNYTVTLQFAEFGIEDTQSWKSLGRRVFDIYVQVGSCLAYKLFFLFIYLFILQPSQHFLILFFCRVNARRRTLTSGRQQAINLTLLLRSNTKFL
ncbi:Os04g0616501, partial [Oryza sativa Japonica Group]